MKWSSIAVVDIGSPARGNLGWSAIPDDMEGHEIQPLVDHIAAALESGPVALGFEAPLWIPLRENVSDIMKARQGEGARAWSAQAGMGALCTGLAVISHLLVRLRAAAPIAQGFIDPSACPQAPQSLFMWEAFVTQHDKAGGHVSDARVAARAFDAASADLTGAQRCTPERCLNLLGAMMLRTGWADDTAILQSGLLVLRHPT